MPPTLRDTYTVDAGVEVVQLRKLGFWEGTVPCIRVWGYSPEHSIEVCLQICSHILVEQV
jgi:hypothetical protein